MKKTERSVASLHLHIPPPPPAPPTPPLSSSKLYYAHTRAPSLAIARRKRRYIPYFHPNQRHHSPATLIQKKENKEKPLEISKYPPKTHSPDEPTEHDRRPKYNEFADINDLPGLIEVLKEHQHVPNDKCSRMMQVFRGIRHELEKLNAMVGLNTLKHDVLKQLTYYSQGLHMGNDDYMHTVLVGNPGTGKTELAHILAHMFANIGMLKKSHVHKVTRADLVASYLGQTAIKTTEAINDALDGVLFIDEAYSLGSNSNSSNSDSYSKECIDTLCEQLSLHRGRLLVILAGYEDQLNDCFFRQNQGLRSRFLCWHRLPNYTAAELSQIFLHKNYNAGWRWISNTNRQEEEEEENENYQECHQDNHRNNAQERSDPPADNHNSMPKPNDNLRKWFEKNLDVFKNNGRDVENILTHARFAYSWRIFRSTHSNNHYSQTLSTEDLDAALKQYKNTQRNNDEDKNRHNCIISREMMYT